jgi:hypothetical protein
MTVNEFYRRADFSGGFYREIDLWKIIDIHEIPKVMLEQYEVDFYCCNDKEVYLLRLRNRKTKKMSIVKDTQGYGYPPYLIAELPIDCVNNNLINELLIEFGKMLK